MVEGTWDPSSYTKGDGRFGTTRIQTTPSPTSMVSRAQNLIRTVTRPFSSSSSPSEATFRNLNLPNNESLFSLLL